MIGAIGPVAAYDDESYRLVITDPRVQINPNCRQPNAVMKDARDALRALCRGP